MTVQDTTAGINLHTLFYDGAFFEDGSAFSIQPKR